MKKATRFFAIIICLALFASLLTACSEPQLEYEINEDGKTCTITRMVNWDIKKLVISSEIDGYTVTHIGNGFKNCTLLTSLTIPDSVTSIGLNAFFGCTSLTSITIPDSVTNIGGSVFEGCTSLAGINYTGTIEEWKKIGLAYDTSYYIKAIVVHCTDGDVNID